jgi:hypothetical protein
MRALADAQADGGGGPLEDLEAEDEEDPQGLDELNLTMEVRADEGGDGAGLAGEGPQPDAGAAA